MGMRRMLLCRSLLLLGLAGAAVPWGVGAASVAAPGDARADGVLAPASAAGVESGERVAQQAPEFNLALLRYGFSRQAREGDGESLDVVLILPEQEPRAWRVAISREQFAAHLRASYRAIASLQPTVAASGEADPLYQLLIAPVREALEANGVTTLLISADRGLQAVPFAALHDGEHYVAERYSFALTPSLALTPLAIPGRAREGGEQQLAFASTRFADAAPLPLAREEVKRIAGGVQPQTFVDEAFTADALLQGMVRPEIQRVHVASHAEFGADGANVYTGQGKLPLGALSRVGRNSGDEPLELFYLSACRTAVGNDDAELGFSGMALQTGAVSAIGSLWNVDDLASAAFAVMVYRYLASGLIKAEAAMAARLVMLRGELRVEGDALMGPFAEPVLTGLTTRQKELVRVLRLPYFWAGINVVGSPW